MQWLRIKIFQSKTNYCTHCGYSFRRTLFGRVILNPIYAIGLLNTKKRAMIFITKNDYDGYKKAVKRFVFTPLINSTNLIK